MKLFARILSVLLLFVAFASADTTTIAPVSQKEIPGHPRQARTGAGNDKLSTTDSVAKGSMESVAARFLKRLKAKNTPSGLSWKVT